MKGYPTIFDGIIFIESDLEDVRNVASISVDLSFEFGAQLKNLNDVKDQMVRKALPFKINCITNFRYGQKSRWLAIDDVAFFGSGDGCIIDQERYDEIISYIKQRDTRK